MTALPEDVAALLAAVVDALDIPLPGATDADFRRHDAVLTSRASDVCIILQGLLERGWHRGGEDAERLRQWTTRRPVTYTPWVPPSDRDGGQQ